MRVSSLNRGMRRLKYPDIVRMAKGQEFTLVVPHLDRKQCEDAVISRKELLNEFRRTVVKAGGWGMNLEQKKHYESPSWPNILLIGKGKIISSSMLELLIMQKDPT